MGFPCKSSLKPFHWQCGGFLKWGYPKIILILRGCSILNQSFWVPHFCGNFPCPGEQQAEDLPRGPPASGEPQHPGPVQQRPDTRAAGVRWGEHRPKHRQKHRCFPMLRLQKFPDSETHLQLRSSNKASAMVYNGLYGFIWWFPKIGVPPNHSLQWGFAL